MKHGNKVLVIFFTVLFFLTNFLNADEKIVTSPLFNIDEIKPSFEESDEKKETIATDKEIKNKKKSNIKSNSSHAVLIGLDKITAKSSKIKININETKKFGPLEIRILKCGKVINNNN